MSRTTRSEPARYHAAVDDGGNRLDAADASVLPGDVIGALHLIHIGQGHLVDFVSTVERAVQHPLHRQALRRQERQFGME